MKKIVYVIIAILFLASCSDDNSTQPTENRIIYFSPTSGSVGNVVEIVIEGFTNKKSELEVKFNGKVAVIDTITKAASNNQFVIRTFVPSGATTGKISITYKGKTYYSETDFVVNALGGDLLPLGNGWYWVYKKYQLDTNSNPIMNYYTLDSLVCVGKEFILQQEAYKFLSFSSFDNSNQYNQNKNQYFYKVNNTYFAHSSWFDDLVNFGSSGLVLPFEITDQWVKIINPNQNDWRIYSHTFVNEQFSFGTINGELTIDGINKGSVSTTISSTTFQNAVQVDYKFKFVGNAQTQFGNLPLNLERILSIYYVPGIGKIKSKMLPMRFVVEGLIDQIIPGYEQQLSKNFIN
ncbi:MAG: hypothetical protein N3A67_06405 [Ignavibacteria bacterium]|nr:hypothetical protein [Ignavibacteria bacterium]